MDSLTHALAISVVFAAIGRPDLIPFAALGAVIPDIDVIFQRFSDRDPRLYMFTHGGITHSLTGGGATSLIFALIGLIVSTLLFPASGAVSPLLAVSAALLGTLSHVLLDYLAYPGIPLLYPLSDHKYTMGIMAGPSMFLTLASIAYLVLIVAGIAEIGDPWPYVAFFIAVIMISTLLKLYVGSKVDGMAIPGFDQVNWLIVEESSDSFIVYKYRLLKGPAQGVAYKKVLGEPDSSIIAGSQGPELRRMRYHSYIVTEEHGESWVRYTDPLREHGHLWYPPYFKSVTIPVKKLSHR